MGKREIKDLNQQLSEKQSKIIENFFSSKTFNSFVCMYKMVDNSAETSNKAEVSIIKIRENDNVNKTLFKLRCIFDSKKRWGGKNLFDLIDNEIKGKYGVKNMSNLTKQQIRKYKIDRSKPIKGIKHFMYVHEDILISIIAQPRLSDPKQSNLELI